MICVGVWLNIVHVTPVFVFCYFVDFHGVVEIVAGEM